MISKEIKASIESQWKGRAAAQGLKAGTEAYRTREVEFFTGAMTAINALSPHPEGGDKLSPEVPVAWVLHALSGQPIAE